MKFKISTLVLVLLLTLRTFSQNPASNNDANPTPTKKYSCGTENPPKEWDQWFNTKVAEFNTKMSANKTQLTSLTIPVIVHVVHGGQSVGTFPNISQAQIKSQISVLNKDFAGTGYNVYQLATKGFSLVGAANCLVSFCLAQTDPNGVPLAEPGIERINYVTKGWTNPAAPNTNATFKNLIDGTIKANSIWDPTQYFNIWVTDINSANDLLGYATFPGGSGLSGISSSLGTAASDGVWCYAMSFGSTGTLLSGYNLGRTATHEVGHWLGLRHIGGDALNAAGDCNATDYCNDTPPQIGGFSSGSNGQNFGYPNYPWHANGCGSIYGEMFMNFMDYTYDPVKYMYTPDQATRIQTAMANGYFRNQLNASSANLCTGAPTADFSIDSLVCMDSEINILNLSSGSPAPTYSWSVVPSTGAVFTPSNTSQSPKITYSSPGTYTLSLVITNSIGVSTAIYEQRAEDCTGLNKITGKGKEISLYPNPTTGKLSIHSPYFSGQDIVIEIMNSIGQVVFSKTILNSGNADLNFDLSDSPIGIYAVTISNHQEKVTKRLVLSK